MPRVALVIEPLDVSNMRGVESRLFIEVLTRLKSGEFKDLFRP
jgi:hypothetical protein